MRHLWSKDPIRGFTHTFRCARPMCECEMRRPIGKTSAMFRANSTASWSIKVPDCTAPDIDSAGFVRSTLARDGIIRTDGNRALSYTCKQLAGAGDIVRWARGVYCTPDMARALDEAVERAKAKEAA